MRWLIDYIRSCFCKHEWELLSNETAKEPEYSWMMKKSRWLYRCKKCGCSKMYQNY